jgi:hypothetical protein
LLSQLAKTYVFLIVFVFTSTKLEKKPDQVLPGSEGFRGEREGAGDRGQGGEMAQTMYVHMNKGKKNPNHDMTGLSTFRSGQDAHEQS